MTCLLHTCCGPCASACAPVLRAAGDAVTLFFSNSNLDSFAEYERRLAAARTLADAEGVPLVADPYDHAAWLRQVAVGLEAEPERGARCAKCFRFNLARTAAYAAAHGFAGFTTSLTVSPHKPSPVVFAAGEAAARAQAEQTGAVAPTPCFRAVDFKKKDGFLRSLRRSAELDLYRQDYCGCEFSRRARPSGNEEDPL